EIGSMRAQFKQAATVPLLAARFATAFAIAKKNTSQDAEQEGHVGRVLMVQVKELRRAPDRLPLIRSCLFAPRLKVFSCEEQKHSVHLQIVLPFLKPLFDIAAVRYHALAFESPTTFAPSACARMSLKRTSHVSNVVRFSASYLFTS